MPRDSKPGSKEKNEAVDDGGAKKGGRKPSKGAQKDRDPGIFRKARK